MLALRSCLNSLLGSLLIVRLVLIQCIQINVILNVLLNLIELILWLLFGIFLLSTGCLNLLFTLISYQFCFLSLHGFGSISGLFLAFWSLNCLFLCLLGSLSFLSSIIFVSLCFLISIYWHCWGSSQLMIFIFIISLLFFWRGFIYCSKIELLLDIHFLLLHHSLLRLHL